MEISPSTVHKDPISFVSNLELSQPKYIIERVTPVDIQRRALESGKEEKAESYLSNKSLLSFVANVSGDVRQDVLNSTLLAQLAADKKFPGEEALKEWFKVYQETLNNIGWTVQGKEFSRFKSSHGVFEMENVILDILGTAMGGNAIAIIAKTLESFKKLSDTDNRILAFERNSHTLTKGTFLIGIVDQTNDAVSMKVGAFQLSSSNQIMRILFFKSEKEKTELSYSTSNCTLDQEIYGIVRNRILEKLGTKISEYVAEIEI